VLEGWIGIGGSTMSILLCVFSLFPPTFSLNLAGRRVIAIGGENADPYR
jgi:hypothetical protein